MTNDTHHTPLSLAYARALLELAEGKSSVDETAGELRDLRTLMDQNPAFEQLLTDPAISNEHRERVIRQTFENRGVTPLVFDFLLLLNHKNRIGQLRQIADAYDDLLEEKRGIVEVDVTVAHRLDDAQLNDVKARVSAALKREAVVHQYVDESIIGGLILRVQDKLIDGSVRAQLQQIKRKMLEARPADAAGPAAGTEPPQGGGGVAVVRH